MIYTISSQSLISLFRQALNDHWGYIWGTAGEKWTAAKQAVLEKTVDSDRAQGRKYGSKWIGHRVADCSGLFSWAFKQLGGYMYHGSDTMYRKYCSDKGELKKGKRTDYGLLKPGTAVFVWDGQRYSHVGLYVGDDTVIEAMGTVNGVTTTKVTAGKWTHWGELTGVDYSGSDTSSLVIPSEVEGSPPAVTPGEVVGTPSANTPPTLRKGSKGTAVKELQTLLSSLGYDLGPCGVDGDFGKATEAAVRKFQTDHGLTADSVCGTLTWSALEQAKPAEKTYAVRITGLSRSRAEEILSKYGGTMEEG